MLSAKIEKNELVIRITLNEKPEPSKSGKTDIAASSRGPAQTDAEYHGKKIVVNLNAYVNRG